MSKADPKTSTPYIPRKDMPEVLQKIKRWTFRIGRAYMQRKRPPSDARYIRREGMPKRLRDIKDWSFYIVSLHMLGKKPPSEWEKTKLHIFRMCDEEGRPDIAPILIEEIEKEMACWPMPRIHPWISGYGSREES